MASATGLLALLRAVNPQLGSAAQSLAFATHGAILCNGYRLAGVGPDAQIAGAPDDAPEVPVTGWNAQPDQQTFLYQSETAPKDQLLLKCLPVGDTLVVALASSDEAKPPTTIELPISKYTTGDGSSVTKAFSNLDQLCSTINSAVAAMSSTNTSSSGKTQAGASTTAAAGSSGRTGQPEQRPQPSGRRDPDDDPLRIGPPRRPPMRIGDEDIMPGALPGLGPPNPFAPGLGPGSGMHVGPGHPFFADRMRHPDLGPGGFGSGQPGPRWDPIAPEGLEGWRPEDYRRGPPGRGGPGQQPNIHPDIGPPAPGRGMDWDSMFG